MDEKPTSRHAAPRIKEGEYVLPPRGRHAATYRGKHQGNVSAVEALNSQKPEMRLLGYVSDNGVQPEENMPSHRDYDVRGVLWHHTPDRPTIEPDPSAKDHVLTQREWEQVRRQMGVSTKEGRPWTA